MKLDPVHPISIDGTPIAENDTFRINANNWQKDLRISFNMADGTSISNWDYIDTNKNAWRNESDFQITNDCIGTVNNYYINSKNIANGQVTF